MSRLHSAAWIGDANTLEQLIDKGLDPNVQHPGHKSTPLHYAARRGHPDIAKLLIAHGADVIAVTKDEQTPYDLAKKHKQADVSDLLEKIAKQCRLHLAAREGNTEELQKLIEKGEDVNSRKYIGVTPLHIAAACGHVDVIRMLLQNGAKTRYKDPRERTVLHFATIHNQPQAIHLLLSYGMKSDSQDEYGRKARDYAQENFPTLCEIFDNPPEVVDEFPQTPQQSLPASKRGSSVFQFPSSPSNVSMSLQEMQTQLTRLASAHELDKASLSSTSTMSQPALDEEDEDEDDSDNEADLKSFMGKIDPTSKSLRVLHSNEIHDVETLRLMSKDDLLTIGIKMGVALKILGALH